MLDKTFYFIVVVWGDRFRNYFLNYCLPSLLSPGNIPAISTVQRSKFVIATRPDDWALIKSAPIFQLLQRYADPIYLKIAEQPPGRSGCEHMNEGHKVACNLAYNGRGLAMILTPDCMLSDGSVARLQELALKGVEVVLVAALRFGEEPFLGHLYKKGLIARKGEPLAISGRDMATAAISGLHPETMSYRWDSPYLIGNAPAAWWPVPGEDGLVLHCLSWAPLLIDYGTIYKHDTTMLDTWTIDGDYIFNNFGTEANIYVVRDSDEIFIASWARMDENAAVFQEKKYLVGPIGLHIQRLMRGAQFRRSFFMPTFDPLKRKIFFEPVRWHSKPLTEQWAKTERKTSKILQRWLGTSPLRGNIVESDLSIVSLPLVLLGNVLNFSVRFWIFFKIHKLLRGDRKTWEAILRRARRKLHDILDRRNCKWKANSPDK